MKRNLLYLLIVTCISTRILSQDVTSNLYVHYPLDGNANNAASASFNGALIGNLAFINGINDASNTALSFDGVDDKVTFGDIDLTIESFTLSFWIKLPSNLVAGNVYRIMSMRSTCTLSKRIQDSLVF